MVQGIFSYLCSVVEGTLLRRRGGCFGCPRAVLSRAQKPASGQTLHSFGALITAACEKKSRFLSSVSKKNITFAG